MGGTRAACRSRLPHDVAGALQYIDALDVKSNERKGNKGEFQIDLDLHDANQSVSSR